jgi:hypothetical protein
LSYFNESVGGPLNGPRHLLGSNVDWCQDLRYLKWWTNDHPEVNELYLAYHGLFDPAIANFPPTKILPIEAPDSTPAAEIRAAPPEVHSQPQLPPGIYAISINVLYDQWAGRSGRDSSRLNKAVTKALRETRPYDRAGCSILIFRVL